MRRSHFPFLLCLTAYACGSDDGPSAPSVLQVGGQWNFSETYTDTTLATTCTNQSTVNFVQTGSTFTGNSVQTGSCTDATGTFDNSGGFQLRNGSVDASNVSWNDDGLPVCNYTGTISGTPPDRMSGTVRCNGVVSGITFDARGTWQMTR
jgi:hypothetical protein